MKIALTGASGMMGSRFIELNAGAHTIIPFSSTDLDITDESKTEEILARTDFDILLHLAAYTNVNGAELEKEKAHAINVNGTRNVFNAVQNLKKQMIYISTDFVFDGKLPPFDELSTPSPVGYYAETKYEGEKIVEKNAMIVRISYPYGYSSPIKQDFMWKMQSLLSEGKTLNMITDSAMNPTFIDDVVSGLYYLATHYEPTIYHLVGSKSYTPFEVGTIIAKRYGFSSELIQPTTFQEFSKGNAPRPQYSIITSTRNTFQPMRNFEEGLALLKT